MIVRGTDGPIRLRLVIEAEFTDSFDEDWEGTLDDVLDEIRGDTGRLSDILADCHYGVDGATLKMTLEKIDV